MNDDQFLLANAYLDGELTDDEVATAETDPDVMSEVERLRVLQADVRTVAAPSEAVREAAISAAMDQFRAAPAAATAPVPRTVQFRPPPWYRRYLAVAAAIVAVGLLGVVVVNVGRSGNDDDSASISADDSDAGNDAADEAAEAPAADADNGRDFVESADGDSGDDNGDAGGDDAAADSGVAAATTPAFADDDTLDDLATAEADDGDMADSGDDDAGGDDAEDGQPSELPPGSIAVERAVGAVDPAGLPDEVALLAIGDELRTLRISGEAPASPNTFCVFPDVEDPAEILSRASFETESGPIELLVAVDDTSGLVYGIDPTSCEILVEGLLP